MERGEGRGEGGGEALAADDHKVDDEFLSSLLRSPSVEEEEPLPGGSAEAGPGALDVHVLHDGAHADEHAEGHDQPPEPPVAVHSRRVGGGVQAEGVGRAWGAVSVVAAGVQPGQVGAALDDQRPLGQGEAKSGQGAVPA